MIIEPFTKDFSYRFCWSSNALEGNTLSLEETISLIEFDEVCGKHKFSEYMEAKGLYTAIQNKMIPFRKQEITETWIKESNALIGESGEYRLGNVYIGSIAEAVYYPPVYTELPERMKAFIENVNTEKKTTTEAIEEIVRQHIEFERIHPFSDGNGRVGRMILNQQMINNDMLPVVIKPTGKYRQAFRAFDKNLDISVMIYLIGKGEIEALDRIEALQMKKCNNFHCEKNFAKYREK